MDIKIIKNKIGYDELKRDAKEGFGDMVKAVVDVEQNIIALGGELHADGEATLLEKGSKQEHLWGINLYPDKPPEEMIEYTSLINVRPSENNPSVEIEDEELRKKIANIIHTLIG